MVAELSSPVSCIIAALIFLRIGVYQTLPGQSRLSPPLMYLFTEQSNKKTAIQPDPFFSTNFFLPMPPHVLMNFRGFPPGCGDSVADC